jgi:prepilin-type N-terminal cleavage/methylation domain-containing protein
MVQHKPSLKQKGFSLIELLVVLSIFTFIMGGIFTVYNKGQGRFVFEQDVAEAQQTARNVVDMMEREIRLAGFPKTTYYDSALGYNTNSNTIATGFTTSNGTDMIFEGDINEDGIADVVEYNLNGTTLQRSAVAKPGGGVAATPSFKTLAENVRSLTFTYYNSSGVTTTVPANVRRVKVNLNLSTNRVDPDSRRLRTVSVSTMAFARNL